MCLYMTAVSVDLCHEPHYLELYLVSVLGISPKLSNVSYKRTRIVSA